MSTPQMSTESQMGTSQIGTKPTRTHNVTSRVMWVLAGILPFLFLLVFFCWPVVTLIGKGFFDATGFTGSYVVEVLSSARTWRIVGQTLEQAVLGTLMAVLVGVPGAYVIYRCRWPGRNIVRAVVTVPFVLPTVVVGVAFRSLFTGSLEWLDGSFGSIIAALVFFNYCVIVRQVGVFWSRLDSRAEDAARTLGANQWRVFRTVTLPALWPAIAAAAALVFLFCATAFSIVLILGQSRYGTIETEIYFQTTQLLNLPAAAGLSILQLLIVCAALIVSNITQNRQERALQLRTTITEKPLRKADVPAAIVTFLVVVGLLLTPIISLVVRSFISDGAFSLVNYLRLAEKVPGLDVTVWQAVSNSLLTALTAMGISLILGVQLSYLLSRRPASRAGRRLLGVCDAIFMLPLGVSAVTVGFGFLITLNRPPLDLRSSWLLIPLAQALVALPLVIRTLLPTWRAIDPRLGQAAATLGAPPRRVFWTIEVPFLVRGFTLAAGFAFATSLGEFGATSFLARPDFPTLPVVIFRLLGRPDNFGVALAACVILTLLTAVTMGLAEYDRGRNNVELSPVAELSPVVELSPSVESSLVVESGRSGRNLEFSAPDRSLGMDRSPSPGSESGNEL